MDWKTVERPGYLSRKRDEMHVLWDETYGSGNWRLAYQWGDQIIDRAFAISLYEDGYYEYFKNTPEELNWLITTASEVYDTAPSNVEAGFSYEVQETPNNHIHDVAIRRAVARLGVWFQGDHLIHVRGEGSEGERINPGNVPFHLPEMIANEPIQDYGNKGQWWQDNSIEDFYQKNKLLQVKIS